MLYKISNSTAYVAHFTLLYPRAKSPSPDLPPTVKRIVLQELFHRPESQPGFQSYNISINSCKMREQLSCAQCCLILANFWPIGVIVPKRIAQFAGAPLSRLRSHAYHFARVSQDIICYSAACPWIAAISASAGTSWMLACWTC